MEDNRGGLKTLIAVLAGFDSIKKNKVVMARCPAFVRDAVKLVEKVV